MPEIGVSCLLHLHEHVCSNLRRGVLVAECLNPSLSSVALYDFVGHVLFVLLHLRVIVSLADESLGGEDGVVRVGDGLSFGWCADQPLSVFGECYDGGSGVAALGVGNDLGYLVL